MSDHPVARYRLGNTAVWFMNGANDRVERQSVGNISDELDGAERQC